MKQLTEIDLAALSQVTGAGRFHAVVERAHERAAWVAGQIEAGHRAFWRWYTAPLYM